ncbi:sushi, von Willebrand factor type A, EGF and pentraxin domain-containing protein 1-like [Patiria miniata]|uniref:HYR domain-containing protein n=1 Tax=Patiria miniata TaxID=46514 RepID=A0A913Z381_PATMI|nr:sushi, von Willebrand factor type A, EGF and pentraxin domain-containing protein 1-like [Patiria miniata]
MKVFLLVVFVGLASGAYAYPAGEVEERSLDDLKAELIRALEERYPQRDVDYIAPYFTFCPADITVSAPPGSDSAQVSWEDAIVTDNSGVQPKVEMSPPNPNPFSVGQHLVSYRATDGAGNVSSCVFVVTVVKAGKRSLDDLKVDLIRALEERLTEAN